MKTEDFTPAQSEAISARDQSILVVASPGSGKTSVVIARIDRLLSEGTDPSQIAAVTFTNAGAHEVQRRLPKDKDGEPIQLGFTGTLHSFALRMLKQHGAGFGYGDRISLITPEAARDIIESKARTFACREPIKTLMELKALGRPERPKTVAEIVLASYFDEMRAAGIADYDILLQELVRILASDEPEGLSAQMAIRNAFSHLLVDEVQDSAPIDWAIYLSLPIDNKFYCGDPDQSIFSFRGGSIAGIMAAAGDVGTRTIKLEDNFRSRQEICQAAQSLIEKNSQRVSKETRSVSGDGGVVEILGECENEGDEIGVIGTKIRQILSEETVNEAVPGKPSRLASQPEIAVLARTNAIADGFRKALAAVGLPVKERTVQQLPRDWALARSFVELCVNPENDSLAFFHLVALEEKRGATPKRARSLAHIAKREASAAGRSLNQMHLGFHRSSTPELALAAMRSSGVSLESQALAVEKFRELPRGATVLELALALSEVREWVKEEKDQTGINILTIHGAKGREFDCVFLVGVEDEVFPGKRALDAGLSAVEEERRLLYVGMTRARRMLFVSSVKTRTTAWREVLKRTPSRFLKEIDI